jgi:hypothetical protein
MNSQTDGQSTLLDTVNAALQGLEESRRKSLHAVVNARAKLTQLLTLPLVAADMPAVIEQVRDLLGAVREVDERSAALLERVAHAYQNAAQLARPTLPPTAKQRVEAVAVGLRQLGWNGLERESLEVELGADEGILSCSQWEVVTNERVIDRAALQDRLRPGSWTRKDTWLAQFPEIPPRTDRAE